MQYLLLGKKNFVCTCAFLDVSQAFDSVRYDGLLYNLKSFLQQAYYSHIKSYLSSQGGSLLSPIIYNIYALDQLNTPFWSMADYADDNVLISTNDNSLLQNHIHSIKSWFTPSSYEGNKTWRDFK